MQTVHEALLDTLRHTAIPFAQYMNLALYHPQGYYNRRVSIGGAGADFYTATGSQLFGRTLARYGLEVWERYGSPSQFQVVEIGAGQGELALHLCTALTDWLPATVALHYTIVETSPFLEQKQRRTLSRMPSCKRLHAAWGAPITSAPTLLIANEVLDALPVDRYRRADGRWLRAYVCNEGDRSLLHLDWRPADESQSALAARWLPIPDGTDAELSPLYASFLERSAGFGQPLTALFFDYGIFVEDLQTGLRPHGTVRGFYQHRIVDPLFRPGDADITADVHWAYAQHLAEDAGFHVDDLVSQGAFLMQAGILKELERLVAEQPGERARFTSEFKRLALPGGMGERFTVMQCRT